MLSFESVEDDRIRQAVSSWPRVDLSEADFAGQLEEPLSSAAHLADLYLARAALRGDQVAVREIGSWVHELCPRAIRATGVHGYDAGDLEQDLLQQLVVGSAARPAKLDKYSGSGPLRAWLRSCAIRQCLMRRRSTLPDAPAADVPANLADPADDPELRVLKAHDREAFSTALAAAFTALDPATRTLLRYYYVDRLDQKQIAAVHQVHVATISRRLDKARAQILDAIRAALEARGTPTRVWTLVRSRLDVSLRSLLRTAARGDE